MPTEPRDAASPSIAPDHVPLSRRELALVAAFWVLYATLTLANRLFDEGGPGQGSGLGAVAIAFTEPMLWALCTPGIFRLASRFDTERTQRSRQWMTQLVLVLVVGIVLALVLGWIGAALRSTLGAPRPRMDAAFPDPGRDAFGPGRAPRRHGPPLWIGFVNALVMYVGVLAAGLARAYSLRYRARREHAAHLETQLAEARLDALRRQLDPHFLFNTLNAVSALVERDPRGVRRMIARLSDLLRHSFEGSEGEVPLRQELALLGKYVDIMQVRFQGRLTVETHVDDDALPALVPALVLQPLVENAIKHGVERLPQAGRIDIEAAVEHDPSTGSGQAMLVLRVRDDGPGPGTVPAAATNGATNGAARRGVGLRNTVARLEQLYGTRQRFTLAAQPAGGTVAEIRLPYHAAAAAVADPFTTELARVD